jgi:hypothetical protein
VEQVRAVTTTTKEIEAKISTDVWDRQKKWEMKRDVLFEATRRLGAFGDALVSLHTTFLAEKLNRKPDEPEWSQVKGQAAEHWREMSTKFDETSMLVGVVCGKELKDACNDIRLFARKIASGIFNKDLEIYLKSAQELVAGCRIPAGFRVRVSTLLFSSSSCSSETVHPAILTTQPLFSPVPCIILDKSINLCYASRVRRVKPALLCPAAWRSAKLTIK